MDVYETNNLAVRSNFVQNVLQKPEKEQCVNINMISFFKNTSRKHCT